MPVTFVTILVLSIASLLASIISGATGLGGGTLLLAVIMLLVRTEYIIPLHAALQFISNGTASPYSGKISTGRPQDIFW